MIIVWILLGLIYFIGNSIIALSWASDTEEKTSPAVVVTLLLAGIPIMIFTLVGCLVVGVISLFMKDD